MPPVVALTVWVVALLLLLRFDPGKDRKTSFALWIPVIWMFNLGSRLPSQWLNGNVQSSIQGLQDGNVLDRSVGLLLIGLAVGILVSRSFQFSIFIERNKALIVFLSFALISVLWSDYPFVTFKRWFRDVGCYLVILVVLSDPRPLEAVRTVLRRLSYLLVPLSILLIKYFPVEGRNYSYYTGTVEYVGAGTSKNMLGLLCLMSGLYFAWDTVARWRDRKQKRDKRILLLNVAFLLMTGWLMKLAHSTTSNVCLALGVLVLVLTNTKFSRRHPLILKATLPALFGIYLFLNLGLGMNGQMAQALGKDSTLTDRTKIWAALLNVRTNPVVGTGYQSFWLGERLDRFWATAHVGHINEAHNGYLEVYLELGVLGVILLSIFLLSSYNAIYKRLAISPDLAALGLASWLVLVFYNMSEAAFEDGLLFSLFLMVSLVVPERSRRRVQSAVAVEEPGVVVPLPRLNQG